MNKASVNITGFNAAYQWDQ